jgi:fatty acid desaturase
VTRSKNSPSLWFTVAMLAVILSTTWLLEPRFPKALVAVPGAIVVALLFAAVHLTGHLRIGQAYLRP